MEYNAHCRYFMDVLSQVDRVPLYSYFDENYYRERVLDFRHLLIRGFSLCGLLKSWRFVELTACTQGKCHWFMVRFLTHCWVFGLFLSC